MSRDVSVKIYGCRGSIPVSGAQHARYGGATSCVGVRVGDRRVIFDAGSGLRTLSDEIAADPPGMNEYLFFSHSHFDHLIGLPYFVPMYRPDATLHLFGPPDSRFNSFEGTIDNLLRPPFHPVSLFEMLGRRHFHDIGEAHVVYFLKDDPEPLVLRPQQPGDAARVPSEAQIDFAVHCMRGYNHPKSGVNIYKLVADDKIFVYATDTEGYVNGDRRLISFARGADLLIHDAMYTEQRYVSMPVPTQGYGHSTVEIATSLARQADVKRLLLWHHDPTSDDEALDRVGELATSLFDGAIVARDGLEISL